MGGHSRDFTQEPGLAGGQAPWFYDLWIYVLFCTKKYYFNNRKLIVIEEHGHTGSIVTAQKLSY